MSAPDLPLEYWRAANSHCRRWRNYHYGHEAHPFKGLPWRHDEGVLVMRATIKAPWFISPRRGASKIHVPKWAVSLWGRSGPVLVVKAHCGAMISHPSMFGRSEDAPTGFVVCASCALASHQATIELIKSDLTN